MGKKCTEREVQVRRRITGGSTAELEEWKGDNCGQELGARGGGENFTMSEKTISKGRNE